MALVECKKCGKKVSDTIDKCIHCGASLKNEPTVVEVKPKPIIDANALNTIQETPNMKKFNSLSDSAKNALEKEFLETDEKFYKFRRKELEFGKRASVFYKMATNGLIIVMVCRVAFHLFLKGEIFNETMLMIGVVLCVALIACGLVGAVGNFIAKKIYNRSIKKYVYLKSFQKWLKETKNIQYLPIFVDDKEKAMFDEIDLKEITL